MDADRKRFTATAAVVAAIVLGAAHDSYVLAYAPQPEPVLRPRRVDARSSSLEWMPDVAERLQLLEENGCRKAALLGNDETALDEQAPRRGACNVGEREP